VPSNCTRTLPTCTRTLPTYTRTLPTCTRTLPSDISTPPNCICTKPNYMRTEPNCIGPKPTKIGLFLAISYWKTPYFRPIRRVSCALLTSRGRNLPKSAEGAQCNSLRQRPRVRHCLENQSAESAK
jgi:hypothetical protein